MAKRRRSGADAPGQIFIEWRPAGTASTSSVSSHPEVPNREASHLVQRLKWDFRESFPEPLPEAVEAGVVDESDLDPQNIRSLHENYARECLAALKSLGFVLDARRRGVDPATGQAPRTVVSRERLAKYFREEPIRLDRTFHVLIDTYGNAFGDEAADAFAKALRARHAGIEVVADARISSPPDAAPAPKCSDEAVQAPAKKLLEVKPDVPRQRFVARLPVPRPVPAAIHAGHFGFNDKGEAIRPTPDEVRAITEQHAAKMIALLDTVQHVAPPAQQRITAEYEAGITAYAEDFGHDAARQLESYIHRQASIGESPARATAGRRR